MAREITRTLSGSSKPRPGVHAPGLPLFEFARNYIVKNLFQTNDISPNLFYSFLSTFPCT